MRLFALSVVLLAAACDNSRKPGITANTTYFWRLTSAEVTFNDFCSDNMKFRTDNAAPPTPQPEDVNRNGRLDPGEDKDGDGKLTGANYFMFKGSADAKQATLLTCMFLDPATCSPSPDEVVFDVIGAELTFNVQRRRAITPGNCSLVDTQSWLFTDKGPTLSAEISHTLSLVDDPVICPQVNDSQKMASPNMQGYEGCTLLYKFESELEPY
ncbi:MAG: hypothetical protein JNK82_38200 [Myxococcaceae bacterium]|nr:hypothetical protein [Myxococcaceae bacterium]